MAAKEPIVDVSKLLSLDRAVADIHEIRKWNPQRFEMEQLTGILLEDLERNICVAFKDVTRDEFWVRGHMPNMPLMPGVVMLEAVAQACSYFTQKHDLLGAKMVGFGGLEEVRFRDPVIPGDRLVVACELAKVRRGRMIICRFQGYVRTAVVIEGMLKGIPIPVDRIDIAEAD